MPRNRSKEGNALEMLKRDHDSVETQLGEFEKLDREQVESVRELALRACAELRIHTALEEEIFYPALRDVIDDEDILNEAAVEHETARMLIEQLENMPDDDPNFHATFTVLGEYVRHHVREEENEMFPAARKAGLDLEALGQRLRARKEQLVGEALGAYA
jgi:hemerythrin-like domain-containing protein